MSNQKSTTKEKPFKHTAGESHMRFYKTETAAKNAFWRWIKASGQNHFFGVVSIWKTFCGYCFSLDPRKAENSPYAFQQGYELVSVRINEKWSKA